MEVVVTRTGLEKRFFDLFSRLVTENGFVLYDLEYIAGSSTLRVFIMNPETGTAQVEDCVKIDHSFDPHVEEDWIPDGFVLEVSSPGIFRKVRTIEQIEMSKNEFVEILLSGRIEESEFTGEVDKKLVGKNKLRGMIEAHDSENLFFKIDDLKLKLAFKKIKKISLDPEI